MGLFVCVLLCDLFFCERPTFLKPLNLHTERFGCCFEAAAAAAESAASVKLQPESCDIIKVPPWISSHCWPSCERGEMSIRLGVLAILICVVCLVCARVDVCVSQCSYFIIKSHQPLHSIPFYSVTIICLCVCVCITLECR